MGNMKKWKKDLFDAIYSPFDDSDHPACPHCNATMDFFGHDDEGDFPLGEGYWKCSNCGFTFYEKDLD